MRHVSRREFLDMVAATGLAGFALSAEQAWGLQSVANPLATYPNRDWERAYRDLWQYDSTYTFTCAPNDTHNCILNAGGTRASARKASR
jgi:nitrate reductase alpha subunit